MEPLKHEPGRTQVCNINMRKKSTLKARSMELTRAHHNNHKFLSPRRYEEGNSAANDVDSKYQSTSICLIRLIRGLNTCRMFAYNWDTWVSAIIIVIIVGVIRLYLFILVVHVLVLFPTVPPVPVTEGVGWMDDSAAQIKTLRYRNGQGWDWPSVYLILSPDSFSHIPATLPPLLAGQPASFLPRLFSTTFCVMRSIGLRTKIMRNYRPFPDFGGLPV